LYINSSFLDNFIVVAMNSDLIIQKFSRILETHINNCSSEKSGNLLSYRFPLYGYNYDRVVVSLINRYRSAFYFQKPAENTRFLGIGKVLTVRSDSQNRFEELKTALSAVKKLPVQHYNGTADEHLPLFVGGMSFSPKIYGDLWKDFCPSAWFIPEFIISETSGECFVSYNVELEKESGNLHRVGRLNEFFNQINPVKSDSLIEPFKTHRVEEKSGQKEGWMRKVTSVVDAIRRNEIKKVVLSRYITIDRVDIRGIIAKITEAGRSFNDCYTFVYKSGNSLFMGISPEKLASFAGGTVICNAIAGSIARGKTDEEDKSLGDALLNSRKNLDEHRIVVEHIQSVLNSHCSSVTVGRFPELTKLPYIQHLYTQMRGVLQPGISMFRVLEDLHPTPAVGGYPLEPALKIINEMEEYDRGLYTGFLGWFDAEGNGDFCVALRSALLVGNTLHAFAGGGIVIDSEPLEEFEETEIKLQAITSLLYP
jgi:menaquinone-specific isochorismate synthase